MFHRSHSLLIIRLLLCVGVVILTTQTARTQYQGYSAIVELKPSASIARLAERHRVDIVDKTGNSYLVVASPASLRDVSEDPSVTTVEPEFTIEVSERAVPANAAAPLLNPDTVALLNSGKFVWHGGTQVKRALVRQPAFEVIDCEYE